MLKELIRPCVNGCKDYVPGKPVEEVQREYGLTDIVKLASNENPFGTSPKAVEAMCKAVRNQSNLYPEGLCVDLVNKLAAIHGVKTNEILIGNGLDNVITMLGMTYINEGDECIFGELTFAAYDNITQKMGGTGVAVPMAEGERLDLDAFAAAVTPKTKMIWICNPNNPSGTWNTEEECLRLMKAVPENVLVIFDEAYYDFAESPDYPQMIKYRKDYPNMVIMRTFSKVYGMAAERIGYMIAHEEIVKALLKVREPFPVNRIAQVGAAAALDDKEFYDFTVRSNYEQRKFLYNAFDEMGLKYYPSQTNFIFVDIPKTAKEVFSAMLPMGVIIRPMGPYNRPYSVRITVGTEAENKRFIEAFKKALA